MSLISLDEGRAHLRVEPDYPAEQIQPYLDGADAAAQRFLNRNVYPDQAALDAARAGVPAALAAALAAREQAQEAAGQIADPATARLLSCAADDAYADALESAQHVLRGMVLTANIRVALLLLLGHLSENRETVARGATVTDLPVGAEHFLLPDRVGWGG